MFERSFWSTVDWWLVGLYLLLVIFGWLNIYASEYDPENARSIFSWSMRSGKQLLWILTSIGLGALILLVIPVRFWEAIAPIAYSVVCVLLVAVIFLGTSTKGSHSWFVLGPVSFQPAELSKLTTSLILARWMGRYNFRLYRRRNFWMTVAFILIPMLIIVAENETGSALVYLSFLFVLYREGLSGWWLFVLFMVIVVFILTLVSSPYAALWVAWLVTVVCVAASVNRIRPLLRIVLPVAAVLAALPFLWGLLPEGSVLQGVQPSWLLLGVVGAFAVYYLARGLREGNMFRLLAVLALLFALGITKAVPFVFNNVLQEHQRTRIEVLLGMKEDLAGAGYNVHQSMIAIGSGGLTGKGYLEGTQSAYGFVPEQSTDFIFCTIGEEWGFVGCVLTLLLYGFLIARILIRSEDAREPFTRIYGYCIAGILFLHVLINVGMTIGLMPVIGIPLPLISYGGSSLWAFTAMIFIFIALCRNEKKYF